jgi:hypothetical protein
MDVSSQLGGSFLTNADLPAPHQVWTISKVTQELVGGPDGDQKICVLFTEFPTKALGTNKTNLGRIADLYGRESNAWIGKQMQVYRSVTDSPKGIVNCIRLAGPQHVRPEAVCDQGGKILHIPDAVAPTAPAQAAPAVTAVPPVAAQPAQTLEQLQRQLEATQQQLAAASQQPGPVAADPVPWEADHAAQQQQQ